MKIFGILNITPDSFSDGGKFFDPNTAAKQAYELVNQGAHAIDIGAESTRPGAVTISSDEELSRLLPVLEKTKDIPVSIDTRNYETAQKALEFDNVKYLNDVSGFADPRMLQLAKQKNVYIIVMHSLSVPADKNVVLTTPPIETLKTWMQQKHAALQYNKVIFDPGIGFGKTADQSKEIVEHADILTNFAHSLGTKILFGHSRKSFLKAYSDKITDEGDALTAKLSKHLQTKNVDYIRVHNVEKNLKAITENDH